MIPRHEPVPPAGARQFEFTPEQDRLVADLASRMRFVGFFLLLAGALGLGVTLIAWLRRTGFSNLNGVVLACVAINAAVLLFLGYWTLGGARSFQDVADTQGRDVTHLIHALTELRRSYGLIHWLLIIGLVLFLSLVFLASTAVA